MFPDVAEDHQDRAPAEYSTHIRRIGTSFSYLAVPYGWSYCEHDLFPLMILGTFSKGTQQAPIYASHSVVFPALHKYFVSVSFKEQGQNKMLQKYADLFPCVSADSFL